MKVLAMPDESTFVAHRKYLRCLMQVLAFLEAPKLPILPISTTVSFNKSAVSKNKDEKSNSRVCMDEFTLTLQSKQQQQNSNDLIE